MVNFLNMLIPFAMILPLGLLVFLIPPPRPGDYDYDDEDDGETLPMFARR